ncbi:chondroitin sulfate N-acetylgalactosaminyltransferase 1-like [Macrobrachium nipponense]|uniref:chondroitin sulfate N-acetylgalactosaminyltransferase 1-like n=1 Tax=Macrobrachium nipponense TaxID=159736 RepID=UPI0030C84EF6
MPRELVVVPDLKLSTSKFHRISYGKVESTMVILHMKKPGVYASLVFLIAGGLLVIKMLGNDDFATAYGKANETEVVREEGKLVESSVHDNDYLRIDKNDQRTTFRQFDSDRVYQIEGVPERSLTPQEQEGFSSVREVASAYLKAQMKEGTFVGGGYRWLPDRVEYDLSFKDYSKGVTNKVTLFQMLEQPKVIRRSESHDTSVVNIILTLQGRLGKYAIFLNHLVKVILPVDQHITLTVVYFSDDATKKAENMTRLALAPFPSTKWVFVPVERGTFSRGRGLHMGAQSVKYSTPPDSPKIVFFCDVDVLMQPEFFGRCRSNAILGRQVVYYPVLFSQYNPRLVYQLHEQSIPNIEAQLTINEQAGFWRQFGFGMACVYTSDYETAGGFPDMNTWGGEDVVLYEKFLSLDHIKVLRSPDPGLFHIYHRKECIDTGSSTYVDCLRSKSLTEGSQMQLGLTLMKVQEGVDVEGILSKRFYYFWLIPYLAAFLSLSLVANILLAAALHRRDQFSRFISKHRRA